MWDVDLRTKPTSLHNDSYSWPLTDPRGAQALLGQSILNAKVAPEERTLDQVSLLENTPVNSTKQLSVLNNHTFSNALEG